MRIQKILRNSWANLGNSSQEIPRKCSEELFAGNSEEFPQILFTFSPMFFSELVTRNALELVTRNSLELWEFPWNGLKEIPRTWILGLREIPRNSSRHFHRIFLWKIPGNFRGFSAKLLLGPCQIKYSLPMKNL